MEKKSNLLVSLLILLVVLLSFGLGYVMTNNQVKDSSKDFEVNEIDLQVDADIKKKLLEENSEKQQRFQEALNEDVEIVVLKETGNIEVFHDKTAETNKYIKWLNYSNVNLKLYYTASLSIEVKDIEIAMDSGTGELYICYPKDRIKLSSINVDNINIRCEKGIIGKNYSPNEITSLTLIAKERVEENINNDNSMKLSAENNLNSHIRMLAHKVGINDVKIEAK